MPPLLRSAKEVFRDEIEGAADIPSHTKLEPSDVVEKVYKPLTAGTKNPLRVTEKAPLLKFPAAWLMVAESIVDKSRVVPVAITGADAKNDGALL